jgi:hypothetical protein
VSLNYMIGVSLHAPVLEKLLELIDYSLVTRRVEWLGVFWVELLSPARIWAGCG